MNDTARLLFQRGAVVLKIGENFIFRNEIRILWNQIVAADTWHQDRNTEKWLLRLI